ncbi:hypothetical protein V1478_010438 [Vespula squamosa]|uniref:Uncharacterized protein n=1 Tax=Vespula squamosa TaxID=30214 RepID=A0ABD2AIP4_VESSQ
MFIRRLELEKFQFLENKKWLKNNVNFIRSYLFTVGRTFYPFLGQVVIALEQVKFSFLERSRIQFSTTSVRIDCPVIKVEEL